MWTPWEPVTTEIEGDHVVAVVWRDSLHLFWVTFLEKASANSNSAGTAGDKKLVNASFNSIVAASSQALQLQVDIQLSWSEYFQGKWTTCESGGFGNPITAMVASSFDKKQVFIHVAKQYSEGEESAVRINLFSQQLGLHAFRVVSKNSTPEITYGRYPFVPYSVNTYTSNQFKGLGSLQVNFAEHIETVNGGKPTSTPVPKDILLKSNSFSLLMSTSPSKQWTVESGALVRPFFYQDNQHTFFVEPSLTEETRYDYKPWVVSKPIPVVKIDEAISIEPFVPTPPRTPDFIDLSAKYRKSPKQDSVINSSAFLLYGETSIGETGRRNPTTITEIEFGNVIGGMSGVNVQGRG
jgi:hypothetical protein